MINLFILIKELFLSVGSLIIFAVPIVVYKNKPQPHSWVRWMCARTMKRNQNNLFSFVGKTGSGKTWSAISVAEMMSKIDGVPFTIDHIVFSLIELMNLINSGNLKRGSKIIFDEPQVSISARDFQQEANKVFNYLLSTFRHRNFTLFFATPYESLLDKNTRRLFHGRFETLSVDPNKKTCKLKPRYIEYSDWKAEPYRKRLIVKTLDGKGSYDEERVDWWDVPKPSEELIVLYEQKKRAFTDRLNLNILERLKKYDKSGKSMTSDVAIKRKPLTEKQEKVMKAIANMKETNKHETASKIFGVSMTSINQSVKLAKKKGYTIEEFAVVEDTHT